MNRLILIGNGFDLAHGLKTSYKDFIIWYLSESLGSVGYTPRTHEDRLLQIEFADLNSFNRFFCSNRPGQFAYKVTKEDLVNFIANCFEEQTIKELLNINEENVSDITLVDRDDYIEPDHYYRKPFSVNILSDFLKSLIINCQECNWVDIENEYFDQLKACKHKDNFDIDKVKQLNGDFTYLKQKLEEYLTLQQQEANIEVIPELLNSIHNKFDIEDFEPVMGYDDTRLALGYDKTVTPEITHNLYFLNFNYTDSLNLYINRQNLAQTDFSKVEINYIHGHAHTALIDAVGLNNFEHLLR